MLFGIHPLLSGELLLALDQMGHGDALVISDANFPARRLAHQRVIAVRGASAPELTAAILTVFPIDPAEPVAVMSAPSEIPEAQGLLIAQLPADRRDGVDRVGRHDFYRLAERSALVVQSGDRRPYANLLVHKAGINAVPGTGA